MHRDAYGVVCRLVIDGRDSEPFSLHTRPAPPPWPGRADALRAAARARGLPVAERRALAEARRVGPAARTDTRPRPAASTAAGPRRVDPAEVAAPPVAALPAAPVPVPPASAARRTDTTTPDRSR
jgi:hypothetical protein